VREVNAQSDNPRLTNGLAIHMTIKERKETDAYTEKLSKAMKFVNEHPILSQCVCVPLDRGAAIDQAAFCNFIRMQNELMHTIRHADIHGLSNIDIERHVDNYMYNGEDISNSIQEILLDTTDDEGLRLFHSI
jgi:hypothetical protein